MSGSTTGTEQVGLAADPNSFPGATIYPPEPIKFFIYAADGNLWELYQPNPPPGVNAEWAWTPHGNPGTRLAGLKNRPGPLVNNSPPRFFVITQDGQLFEGYWDPKSAPPNWFWKPRGAPQHTTLVGSAGALILPLRLPDPIHQRFFIIGEDGNLYEFGLVDPATDNWGFVFHGRPNGPWLLSTAIGTPGALLLPSLTGAGPKFFVVAVNTTLGTFQLFEHYWDRRGSWNWTPHGSPPGASGASTFESISEAFPSWPPRFFVTSMGSLWERQWSQEGEQWLWIPHGSPPPP